MEQNRTKQSFVLFCSMLQFEALAEGVKGSVLKDSQNINFCSILQFEACKAVGFFYFGVVRKSQDKLKSLFMFTEHKQVQHCEITKTKLEQNITGCNPVQFCYLQTMLALCRSEASNTPVTQKTCLNKIYDKNFTKTKLGKARKARKNVIFATLRFCYHNKMG
uniref:Uncharacterized protein n=1 Tax=Parietochloris pseudoalveolaris TaxID=3102 RepID=A0A097KLL8_9CHLO|nr:hypothetical protein [Parietochloris pseudoalveolaris]AIT94078.1 hypothetical protein [Parietochloris pseudoalveolaris]